MPVWDIEQKLEVASWHGKRCRWLFCVLYVLFVAYIEYVAYKFCFCEITPYQILNSDQNRNIMIDEKLFFMRLIFANN